MQGVDFSPPKKPNISALSVCNHWGVFGCGNKISSQSAPRGFYIVILIECTALFLVGEGLCSCRAVLTNVGRLWNKRFYL